MTINVLPDKRRIYGVEGAVDYFFDNSEWSAGATFNLIKSETKVSGKWQKLTIDAASPSKATAYIGWAPGDWNLRVQSQQRSMFPIARVTNRRLQHHRFSQ